MDYFSDVRDCIISYARQHDEEMKEGKAVLSSRSNDQEISRDECRKLAGSWAEVVIKGMITFL